ncbi:MAG: hypothetical protein WCT42_00350 [Candidatus Paceibacterota bacterium]
MKTLYWIIIIFVVVVVASFVTFTVAKPQVTKTAQKEFNDSITKINKIARERIAKADADLTKGVGEAMQTANDEKAKAKLLSDSLDKVNAALAIATATPAAKAKAAADAKAKIAAEKAAAKAYAKKIKGHPALDDDEETFTCLKSDSASFYYLAPSGYEIIILPQ